jgi:hypothetical protein
MLTAPQVYAVLKAFSPDERRELETRRNAYNARPGNRMMSVSGFMSFYRVHGVGPLWHAILRALEAHRVASEDADVIEPGTGNIDLEIVPEPALAAPSVSAPPVKRGRPSFADLIRVEHAQRVAEGRHLLAITDEARFLSGWLRDQHPDRGPMQSRSIEPHIRATYARKDAGK